jgi:hypothetical protein
MELQTTAILLLHPLMACGVIGYMWWQYGWKRKSRQLKGEERRNAVDHHEKVGERILILAISTVLIAFIARWQVGLGLLPQSLHGFTGSVGVALLWIMTRWGKVARKQKVERQKHGRAADLLIACMFFHSFLGFLYLFSVL